MLQSKYPVEALAPATALDSLTSVINSKLSDSNSSDRQALKSHLRHAIEFFVANPTDQGKLTKLLAGICKVASSPTQEVFNQVPLETTARKGTTEFFYSGCWYPKNPLLRNVPQYYACKNLKGMAVNKQVHTGANVNSPGLFLVFCHEHSELIGFHLLKYYESTRTVHDLLLSRFPIAPRIIIYDHACDLHLYSIAREPKFFAETSYYCDKLHYGTHKDCSCAYDPFKHTPLDKENTVIYEQVNSQIKHTRKSMSKMTQVHFLFIMRHILYMLKLTKKSSGMTWDEVLKSKGHRN